MNKPSFGVIVGRFQVHELHDGHMELFRIVHGRHNRIIIFLGCTQSGPTRHDPLDFETRRKMIQSKFPDFTVLPLQDKKTDEQWSKELDDRIADTIGGVPSEVVLYGSRDSFAPFYHGRHKVKELDINVPPSLNATDIRAKLTNQVMESSDFRAGIIYAMNQLFPRVITCVDLAILHREEKGVSIFLGKKTEDKHWRFVGGHANPFSQNFEHDALREGFEETGLDLSDIEYVGSAPIKDWRWRGEKDEGIKTIMYVAWSMTKGGAGRDDLQEGRWFDISKITRFGIEEEHRVLWEMLRTHPKHKEWGIPDANEQIADDSQFPAFPEAS